MSEIKYIKTFFGVVVSIMLIMFFVGQIISPDERDALSTNCEEFKTEWSQVLDDGERVSVELPGKIPAEYGEMVTVVTTLPEDLGGNNTICFRSIWQDIEVYIDGELRTSYNTDDTRPFGKNSAFKYVFVEISEDDAGKELEYRFVSSSKYAGTVRKSYIGDKLGILLHLIEESGSRAVIIIMLLFLSIFCLLVCAILKFIYKKTLPLTYLVWTLFFCSVWLMSEVEFRQLIFKNVSVLSYYTYFSLMVIPIPLAIYINDIQDGYYKKIHIIPIVYVSVVLLGATTLQMCNIVEFVEMIPFMHIGLVMAMATTVITITIDLIKKRISKYLFVGIGVFGMIFSGMIEMALYYMDFNISIGSVLAIGLMFLLVMAIIKTGQDLMNSEKKKQEAILARESQAKFLANMSHEIRTPINAVIGMNEMILRESRDVEIQEYAGNIKRASNMLLGLVSDILDFTKIESGQYEIVESEYDLVSMIKDEKLILDARASEKAISVNIDVDPKLPTKLFGDELRIKQIITNLISNAVKYTKEGSVTLKVNFAWLDSECIQLNFSVIDTGIGIKQEDMAELFDNFKRLELDKNRNVQGTGLGLSIAKQLTDLMGGRVLVESEYGKGSKFTITLKQKVIDKTSIGSIDEFISKGKVEKVVEDNKFTAPDAKVLVVDDNTMNISVIKALLKRTKVQVDTVTSGKECLEITTNKKYDIILLDHMMPELDGVATLKMMREDPSNLNQNGVVIALTANAVAGCREMYINYGFSDYFSKPIEANKLDELLLKYLARDLVRMENRQVEANIASSVEEEKIGDLLEIDVKVGLSYCMGDEDIYKEVLDMFSSQCEEYMPQLEQAFNDSDWQQYGIITHGLKGNAKTIGAVEFSKLSLKHEMAGKNQDVEYIKSQYEEYVKTLKELLKKVEMHK